MGLTTFDVPVAKWLSNDELLEIIASHQSEVTPTAIINGNYTVYIKETDECMNDAMYSGFLCRLIYYKGE